MCERSLGPGTHESIRISRQRECVEAHAPSIDSPTGVCVPCRPSHIYRQATVSEHYRIMREVSWCPLYYKNYDIGGKCSGTITPGLVYDTATLLDSQHSTTSPHGLYIYRVPERVRGIDEIAQLVRGPSASEVTARRRAGIEAAARKMRRHAEHFRAEIPPPPCREVRRGPQPGVPIAPMPPCNIGNQRVDYINPRR
jgi:hypothetical protein